MRRHVIDLFETLAHIVAILLEPFQFPTRKREQELALERLRTEATHQQLQLLLEHSESVNADLQLTQRKIAEGLHIWLELFKSQGQPEAHTHTEADQWRVEQQEMRTRYRAAGMDIPLDPEAALQAFDAQHHPPSTEGGLSAASQAFLDDLRAMKQAS